MRTRHRILLTLILMLLSSLALAQQFVQQGAKLVGSGAVGAAQQGVALALSSDGNTALVGGMAADSNAGATWVYTRQNGVWSQQGSRLVGRDGTRPGYQGIQVALSADGDTAIVGGTGDNNNLGAA